MQIQKGRKICSIIKSEYSRVVFSYFNILIQFSYFLMEKQFSQLGSNNYFMLILLPVP